MTKNSKVEQILDRYLILRKKAEQETTRLFKQHKMEVKCSKGCSECCDDISVLPIEWFFLKQWLKENQDTIRSLMRTRYHGENRCPFLQKDDGSCCIYPIRPIICRVHGLPIRYSVEEYDLTGQRIFRTPPEYTFAWCELNFLDYDPKHAENLFLSDEYIDMETWNIALHLLNKEFIAAVPKDSLPPHAGWFSMSTLIE